MDTERLAKIEVHLKNIAGVQTDIKNDQDKIFGIIFGNGDDGMKDKLKSALVQLKFQWWAIGLVLTGLTGIAFFSFRQIP